MTIQDKELLIDSMEASLSLDYKKNREVYGNPFVQISYLNLMRSYVAYANRIPVEIPYSEKTHQYITYFINTVRSYQ